MVKFKFLNVFFYAEAERRDFVLETLKSIRILLITKGIPMNTRILSKASSTYRRALMQWFTAKEKLDNRRFRAQISSREKFAHTIPIIVNSPNLASLKHELESHYKARNSDKVKTSSGFLSENNVRSRNDLLSGFIESATTDAGIYHLHCLYKVAEFELNASTLRANSSAMTLSKKLVMRSAADIFLVLRDFRPRERPAIPKLAEKRLAEWAQMKKGGGAREGSWSTVKEYLGRILRKGRRDRKEREQKQIREYEDKRVQARKTEEKEVASGLEDERWEVPSSWLWADVTREWYRSQEDKKRAGTSAKKQLQALGVIEEESELEPGNGLSGNELEYVDPDTWDGGWLQMAQAEYDWMDQDRKAHPNEWTGDWPRMRLWWDDVRDWAKRWRWRNDVIEEFKTTSESLLLELGKIDGSVTAREFSKVQTAFDNNERHQRLVGYTDNMKIALLAGDEAQFLPNCKLAWCLVEGILRSKGVKQGLETLIKKQDHFRNSFMDFATVAIFFSSITATTLQFSYQSADTTISSTIVNLCWFSSLVLSIASATNSLLGVLVHQSPEYLHPSQNLDFRFLQNWFKYIPPVLLTISGLLFLIGFCGFTFLSSMTFSSQGRAIQVVTTTFTTTNFLALLIIFLLAFTRALRHAELSVKVLRSLTIVSALLSLALLALPYMMIFCWIHHKSPIFPPDYKEILYLEEDFGKRGEALYILYQEHRDKLKGTINPHWEGLKKSLTVKFGGGWKKIKALFHKHDVPTDGGPHTV
ncbi:hypothetical protein SCHPADRAFT_893745 [Schizopora paradoxa]|uniref:Uncharacterized protein n=1 Tax=Schizopora paradoxa TaxID=27342 RepID=A0A0H2R9U5_9AGAM|nr:hypothetical protein SCHPADRAFT_893745 [Schizopora paradoxa]